MEAAKVLLALLGRLCQPERATVLQNRDRPPPAMTAQMTQIATGSVCYRVAPTEEFASGTPILFGNGDALPSTITSGHKGKTWPFSMWH
jgi:hypothetical protein